MTDIALIALDPISVAKGSLIVINFLGGALGLSLLPIVVTILIVKTVLSLALTVLIALTALDALWLVGTVRGNNGTLPESIVHILALDRS